MDMCWNREFIHICGSHELSLRSKYKKNMLILCKLDYVISVSFRSVESFGHPPINRNSLYEIEYYCQLLKPLPFLSYGCFPVG